MFSPFTDSRSESPRTPGVLFSASTRAEFEQLLHAEHGLDPAFDPRVKQALDERLGASTIIDDADIRAFAKSSTLLSRALRGRLIIPNYKEFSKAMDEAFDEALRARSDDAVNEGLGENATYIPPLAEINPEQRIVCACTIDGQFYSRHDGNCSEKTRFTVQSVSKVFTYAIALETSGEKAVHEEVGREPSGRSFNELTLTPAGKPHNPVSLRLPKLVLNRRLIHHIVH
jgi:glutaminase